MSDYLEKKLRLKYFYYIDTDSIISSIKTTAEYAAAINHERNSISDLLHLIFEKIVTASEKYTGFILSNNASVSHGFFGENTYDRMLQNKLRMIGISLFNHCVVRSFISSVEKNPVSPLGKSAFRSSDEYIRLCDKTSGDIYAGYLASEKITDKPKPDKHYAANYTKHYTYFHKRDKLMTSDKLKAECIIEDKKPGIKAPQFIKVKKAYSNPSLFLFWNGAVLNFDKALTNKESHSYNYNLLTRYAELQENALIWKNSQHTNADKVIFDHVIEPIYNFSFNSYMYNLYSTEFEKTESNQITVMDLIDSRLDEIVTQRALTLPLIYNKAIFLDYALHAVLNSDTLESTFPVDPTIMGLKIAKVDPTDISRFISRSNELIPSYFKTLYYIVLPLLEDLWDVLTDKDNLQFEFTRKDYQNFIEEHYDVITYDYSQLKDSDFSFKVHAWSYKHIFKELHRKLRKSEIKRSIFSYNVLIDDHEKIRVKNPVSYLKDGSKISKAMSSCLKCASTEQKQTSNDRLLNLILLPQTDPLAGDKYTIETDMICSNHIKDLLYFFKMHKL